MASSLTSGSCKIQGGDTETINAFHGCLSGSKYFDFVSPHGPLYIQIIFKSSYSWCLCPLGMWKKAFVVWYLKWVYGQQTTPSFWSLLPAILKSPFPALFGSQMPFPTENDCSQRCTLLNNVYEFEVKASTLFRAVH